MSDSNLTEAKRVANLYSKLIAINKENDKIANNYKKEYIKYNVC